VPRFVVWARPRTVMIRVPGNSRAGHRGRLPSWSRLPQVRRTRQPRPTPVTTSWSSIPTGPARSRSRQMLRTSCFRPGRLTVGRSRSRQPVRRRWHGRVPH